MKNLFIAVLAMLSIGQLAAQAPGGVSAGLHTWLKADAGTSTTTDGGALSFWNDQSGNGHNATMANVNFRPAILQNKLNGNPVVQMTAGTKYFNIDLSGVNNHAFTIFTVVKKYSQLPNQFILSVVQSTPNVGFHFGYVLDNKLRHGQYGDHLNRSTPPYAYANETPVILYAECTNTFAKTVGEVRDGVLLQAANTNTAHYSAPGPGVIGRGPTPTVCGFKGHIGEIIIYDRILTAAEKRQVQTYLSVKYGSNIRVVDHLYYNEPSYSGDIFGIGRDMVSQGLNQTSSASEGVDDLVRISSPSDLGNGEYLIVGNNNAATTLNAYAGSNCQIQRLMPRIWKARETGEVGNVTLTFDLTDIPGADPSKLLLMIDKDGDGFDDEMGMQGTYNAPYFTVTNVDLADMNRFTLAEVANHWFAVLNGNASGAIWATSPAGAPQVLTSFCYGTNITIQSGITVNSDWANMTCANFVVAPGAVFNAGSTMMNVYSNFEVQGIFNAQTSTVNMTGSAGQTILGSGIANVYNLTVNNAAGVTIAAASGGVRARNLVQLTAGNLQTNGLLTLMSDPASSGMIGPLNGTAINGNVTVNRFRNYSSVGWINLCSPIQNKTFADWNDDLVTTGFTGSDNPQPYPFNNLQSYTESVAGGMDEGYIGATNITDPIVAGKGYFIFQPEGTMTVDVNGQIFQGAQNIPVGYTNTGNGFGDGWNLVSNPYPCTIDWDAAGWTRTNLDNAVYVWNDAINQYATYLNGISTNGGSRYIPHSQSFYVRANAASPSLQMTENCKASIQAAFKSTSNTGEVMTLNISNGIYSDETTFSRNESATKHYDAAHDAFKLRSPVTEAPYMASINDDGDDLCINSFASITDETIIPLRLETNVSGTFFLTHNGLEAFANGACVVLEDLATGEIYPLNQYETISLSLEAGNDALRFQLRIGGNSLAAVTTAGCAGMNQGSAVVSVDENGPYNINWIDPDGEVIQASTGVTGSDEITALQAGFYTIQIENNGLCGTTETQFLVKQDEPVTATAIVVPATCQNDMDGGIALNLEGGSGEYTITWSNGETTQSLDELAAGDYTAFITDSRNCSSSFAFNVPVKSGLVSRFDTQEEAYVLHNGAVSVDFFNTCDQALNYEWSFGDNTITSDEENPSHLYSSRGTFEVTLKASNEECESLSKKTIRIANDQSEGSEFASSIVGQLTDEGVKLMFYFDEMHQVRINAYNVLGQQLIEPITGTYTRETITFSDRRYASQSLIEITDLTTGERAVIKMGL